jgi:glycosyltransferase involved in cell wall biosynthesis
MRIALDARGANWYRGTGIGTYTANLLKNLLKIDNQDYFHIYWSGNNYESLPDSITKIIMTSRKHHKFFEQLYFPNNLIEENIDIYHIPQNGIGLNSDITCRKIVTIHDLIPYLMPETVGSGYLKNFLRDIPEIIENSDGIITVSECSKRDILKFFPINEDKVFVTPLAADSKYKPLDKDLCRSFLKEKYAVNNPFILYIGGFSQRKNVKSLLIAFSDIKNKINDKTALVIVGANRDDSNSLISLSKRLGIFSDIIFTGYVPEEHLPILYNGCEVFVYPSLYEGFGLPPLEAMSCGAPVITSNLTSIPEVVQDAGILINPYCTDELINALLIMLNNSKLRDDYIEKGLKRASEFSWENTALKTLEIYKTVASFV